MTTTIQHSHLYSMVGDNGCYERTLVVVASTGGSAKWCHVLKETLDLILKELLRLDDPEFDYSMCGCRLRNSCGLPCACVLSTYLNLGEYIPLDSIDIFWRTLNVSWSEPVENEDIQCDDVLHLFKEKFNEHSDVVKKSLLRKLLDMINPSKSRMHNLIPNLNEEPPRHSSFVSQTSTWHDSSMDELSKRERFRRQILKVFQPYISTSSLQDVKPDGNCGFRSIALGLGLPEDHWLRIQSDLVHELESRQEKYMCIFGTLGHNRIYSTIRFVGQWMEMPDTGLVIASTYNKVVVNLSDDRGCATSFPLWSSPAQSYSLEIIVIARVNGDHYIRVALREGFLLPITHPL
ncbi:hypothetical protein Tco_0774191 [Tanacetum coccineum]|uniref:OTU domain-containing protein n=1 Tax=Tanacetum coccineum TaxID=301880 RepID=A0ABQ4ZR97_9ASTR